MRFLMLLKDCATESIDREQMDDIEIWRTAGDFVATLGAEGAVFKAAGEADRHRGEGDAAAARDWLLVLDAVEELVRLNGSRDLLN